MTDEEEHYLRSILDQLRLLKATSYDGPSLSTEVLADNIDWLDCYIERRSRNEQAG